MSVSTWIGHNFLGFDGPVLNRILGCGTVDLSRVIDTLVVSRLVDYSRLGGHSLEAWGDSLGYPKEIVDSFSSYNPKILKRCLGDLEINHKTYLKLLPYIASPKWAKALRIEHDMVLVCSDMTRNGFGFNVDKAKELCYSITDDCNQLLKEISLDFPKISKPTPTVTPKATASGKCSLSSFRWLSGLGSPEAHGYSPGSSFSRLEWQDFNPGSHKQTIDRLAKYGWNPEEPTKGHREWQGWKRQAQRRRHKFSPEEQAKDRDYQTYGWTISEANLSTVSPEAPNAVGTLVRWIALSSRQRRLTEWIGQYNEHTGCIHGQYHSLGAWTHRMSHSNPNQGNIPRPFQPPKNRSLTPLEQIYLRTNGVFRSLFTALKDEYLIGVDAEGIQLRILAHYINDPNFTAAVLAGDPHTLNWKALGDACQSRDDAKTFIYAWLLGAGIAKVASILSCSTKDAKHADRRFIEFYPGLKRLKQQVIPHDAELGYFEGLDGRYVKIWGEDVSTRAHLCLGGYLQNGEVLIMKHACRKWRSDLDKEGIEYKQRNFVHDEWQTTCVRDIQLATHIAEVQADSIRWAGEDLGLRCPMAGSILNKNKELAIGSNWLETH